jgi:hypothetical protein
MGLTILKFIYPNIKIEKLRNDDSFKDKLDEKLKVLLKGMT